MQVIKADYDMMMMIQGLENELYWLRAAVEQVYQKDFYLLMQEISATHRCCSRPRDTDVKTAAAQLQVV